MNLVDSSAWLEFFADGPNAEHFAKPISTTLELIVPTICLYEVFKRVLQQVSESDALQAAAIMQQGHIVDLDDSLSLSAAKISADNKLPMADSIILATARQFNAIVWTQDADFARFDNVQYFEKQTG